MGCIAAAAVVVAEEGRDTGRQGIVVAACAGPSASKAAMDLTSAHHAGVEVEVFADSSLVVEVVAAAVAGVVATAAQDMCLTRISAGVAEEGSCLVGRHLVDLEDGPARHRC